ILSFDQFAHWIGGHSVDGIHRPRAKDILDGRRRAISPDATQRFTRILDIAEAQQGRGIEQMRKGKARRELDGPFERDPGFIEIAREIVAVSDMRSIEVLQWVLGTEQ